MKIALVQQLPRSEAWLKNAQHGCELVHLAYQKFKPDIVVFPEMWSNGFAQHPLEKSEIENWKNQAINLESEYLLKFKAVAKELGVAVAITYLRQVNQDLHNSVAVVNKRGELVLEYSKINICDFGADEIMKNNPDIEEIGCDFGLTAGNKLPVCEIETSYGNVKVGTMICADREMPEIPTELFKKGVEIIIVPNACTWEPIRNRQLQSRAFEILGGVALANYPKPKCNGQSCAFDCIAWNEDGSFRDTQILKTDSEGGIFLANFDIEAIRKFRREEEWRMKNKLKFIP